VLTGVLEGEATARDEVFHGGRAEHLPGLRERSNPCADMNGDAAHFVTDKLDLARVCPRSDLQAELA
jgi:hypothetical protein